MCKVLDGLVAHLHNIQDMSSSQPASTTSADDTESFSSDGNDDRSGDEDPDMRDVQIAADFISEMPVEITVARVLDDIVDAVVAGFQYNNEIEVDTVKDRGSSDSFFSILDSTVVSCSLKHSLEYITDADRVRKPTR